MRGDVRLAVIHAADAQIPHREGMRANFLIPGEHWQLLADVLTTPKGKWLLSEAPGGSQGDRGGRRRSH